MNSRILVTCEHAGNRIPAEYRSLFRGASALLRSHRGYDPGLFPVAWLVSGRLDVEIAGRTHSIGPGDSFRIRGEPFRWANPYDQPAVAIWVIAPPVYCWGSRHGSSSQASGRSS